MTTQETKGSGKTHPKAQRTPAEAKEQTGPKPHRRKRINHPGGPTGHLKPYQWKPGQSGNPGGRLRDVEDVAALARTHTRLAVETLAEIAADGKNGPGARVTAALGLLDRGWGRPLQALAVAHGGADQLAKLLADIDGASRGLPPPRIIEQ